MSRLALLDTVASRSWLPQFGQVSFPADDTIQIDGGSGVGDRFHAEAHHKSVLGADFVYSATLVGDWKQPNTSAHLQFRISDEGRYGVEVGHGHVQLYRYLREDRPPGRTDDPLKHFIGDPGTFDPRLPALHVAVEATGPQFTVSYGFPSSGLERLLRTDVQPSLGRFLGLGRFGVYALADSQQFQVRFEDVVATHDPTALSNFAWLYSTPGYDVAGSKRALVRTLNDLDVQDLDADASSFTVVNVEDGRSVPGRSFSGRGSGSRLSRTLGMQVLEADFTDVTTPGTYRLEATLATAVGRVLLRSDPFEIRQRLVSETMLWPMTTRNAEARRAADDDFRRNWRIESAPEAWSVGLDGAFVADGADDQAGATLRRDVNLNNEPLPNVRDFRFAARITIVAGCDAQLQFRITENERWAVTLQAGSAGGCTHGGGPGAVRVHREGPGVPGEDHLEIVASQDFSASASFRVGQAYDVEVRATGDQLQVLVDGEDFFKRAIVARGDAGGFGLKAWASTVRFGHAQVWERGVPLSHPFPGVWIPYDRATGMSPQGVEITIPDADVPAVPAGNHEIQYPHVAQQHGFYDCNNSIGEVFSHSIFLTALLDVWETRAAGTDDVEQESLRLAILTGVLYLNELYEQGNQTGAYAHQEPGRAAMGGRPLVLTTQFAMYALASFAERGLTIDIRLARLAFDRSVQAWRWLDTQPGGREITTDSVVAARMGRAAERQGRPVEAWFDTALTNAEAVLKKFSREGALANEVRPALRSIPWFEGVYLTLLRGPFTLTDTHREQLGRIALELAALMNAPANPLRVMPQAQDEAGTHTDLAARNWTEMAELPLAFYPIPIPPNTVGDWYLCEHFATAALDCVYLGRLTGGTTLEPLATGNLSWILGLNPGVPTSKTVLRGSHAASGPWTASSLVHNGPGRFARTMEGWRTTQSSAKPSVAEWEESSASPHRETWWIAPSDNGFQSVVNGHVLREGQWHYWSVGEHGWVGGETFMLLDGSFLRAALALEDWRSGDVTETDNPYRLDRFRFVETTHLDRAGTAWAFDAPDRTRWSQASRMATDFALGKGFAAARLTGHHLGERVGLMCVPATATTFFEFPRDGAQLRPFPINNIEDVEWAVAGRAAMEVAHRLGHPAGFFTGQQTATTLNFIGLKAEAVSVFDVDEATVARSPWAFNEIDNVGWAQAARLATDICRQRGFAGGFCSGHQVKGQCQIVAFNST